MTKTARWGWPVAVAIACVSVACVPPEPTSTEGPGETAKTASAESATGGTVLLVEDELAAAWMAFDNGFAQHKDPEWEKRNGILFQLGKFWEYEIPVNAPRAPERSFKKFLTTFEGLTIIGEDAGGNELKVDLPAPQFTWLNLVASNGGTAPLADPKLANYLYDAELDASQKPHCEISDPCTGQNLYPPPAGNCDNPVKDLPSPCLRRRSLHAYLDPTHIVTFWQGAQGWSVSARWRDGGRIKRNEYEFSFPDPLSVEVYRGSTDVTGEFPDLASFARVVKVIIPLHSGVTHGELHHPPTDDYPPVVGTGG